MSFPSNATLPLISPVTKLVPFIVRLLGFNPGAKTLQGTNSYLIGYPDESRILIDTTNRGPNLQKYLNNLRAEFEKCKAERPLKSIIITHWHPDHTEAIQDVLDLAYEVSKSNCSGADTKPTEIKVFKNLQGPKLMELNIFNGQLTEIINDESSLNHLNLKNIRLRSIHTPGHSTDHVCILLDCLRPDDGETSQQDDNSFFVSSYLFTGDIILGFTSLRQSARLLSACSQRFFLKQLNEGAEKIAVYWHGSSTVQNLSDYMQSLNRLKHLVQHHDKQVCLLPAHGQEIHQSLDKINEYIANRELKINKCWHYLEQRQDSSCCVDEEDLLNFVYPNLSSSLKQAALNNLRHYLYWISSHYHDDSDINQVLIEKFKNLKPINGITEKQFCDLLESVYLQPNNTRENANFNLNEFWQWSCSLD